MEERQLSLGEAAERLDISERTARRWIKSGKLRAYKPGRDYRIPESALTELMRESETSPKAPAPSPLEPSFNDVLSEVRRFEARRRLEQILRDGLGHSYATQPLPETVEWAREASVAEILNRMLDLEQESGHLREAFLSPGDFFPAEILKDPEGRNAVWAAIQAIWRTLPAHFGALDALGTDKIERGTLPEDEKRHALAELEREAERVLEEASVPLAKT